MRLQSLELNGFKSFAKKTTLEFGSAITGIVGPNGSGKSNVAEAFRFVLGEQSIKSLRGKRGEDLIFNGSKLVPRGNRASVKVVFDNRDRLFSVDFDEISLERVVHRDGVNDYLLNGTQVRLRDIAELLAQANIGSSGHHIISQGEADRILSSSPKERREMIEDALGLKAYLYKREEAERKLEKTQENMSQVESLRREIAPHLKYLERQVRKVEEMKVIRTELSDKYREYLKREELYLVNTRTELTEAKRGPEEKRRTMDERIRTLRADLAALEKTGEGGSALMRLEEDMRAAGGARESLLREISRLEGELSFIERRLGQLKAKAENADLATVPLRSVRDFILSLKEALKRGAAEALMLTEQFESSVEPQEGSELAELQKDASAKAREVEDLRGKLAAADEEEKGLRSRVQAMRKEMEEARVANRDAERELFSLMQERSEVEQQIIKIAAEENAVSRLEDDWKREREEGAVLVGREILTYTDYSVEVAEVLSEERHVQEERKRKLEKLKFKVEEQGVGSGEDVLREHQEVSERDQFLAKELLDLEQAAVQLRSLIGELTATLQTRFTDGIAKINAAFDEFFKLMFGGGEASLTLVKERKRRPRAPEDEDDAEDEDEDVEEGIDISIQLPHKRIRGLHMLSGGERALTSIALIFATSQVNPPPFLILDETDAALDEANSRRYGDMIETLASRSQLILITHNRETMGRAGIIYGVTMGSEGISKLLSVKFEEAVAVAK
jgi:chromosome segregation protein